LVSLDPTVSHETPTLIGQSNTISWPGIEKVRAACLGIVILDIENVFPDEEALFTPREAARAEELGPWRRHLFTAARLALKRLARQIGVVQSDTPDSGIETLAPDRVKPCLADSDLYCSVSHAKQFVVAVGHVHPVGVDLELVSARVLRIWHLFMPSKDRDLLSASGMNPERIATRAWTMKEAAAKALGLDLSEAIHEVEILLVGEQESALRHHAKTCSVKHAEGEGHVLSLLTCGGS
jgi:phosphopantetheinyl transferase